MFFCLFVFPTQRLQVSHLLKISFSWRSTCWPSVITACEEKKAWKRVSAKCYSAALLSGRKKADTVGEKCSTQNWKKSVISRRKDARRGALTEKMGLMLNKSLCLMFEAFEDRKKKCCWQVCALQFRQQVLVWCGWLDRQRFQGCIKEPKVFSVTVQFDLHVLELHGTIIKWTS